MSQYLNTYGSIGSRTNLYADVKFLERATPKLILERYVTTKKLPKNKTLTISFRRSIPLDVSDVPLQEGVTPTPEGMQFEDVQTTIRQYGSWIQISDVIADTHEDPVLNEATSLLSDKAAQVRETVNWGVYRSGTNVFYGSTSPTPVARTDVNDKITSKLVRRVEQFLDAQYATRITTVLKATPDYGTTQVPPAYIGITHTDLRGDLYDISGFRRSETYAQGKPEPEEVGSADGVRFVLSAFLKPLLGAGNGTAPNMRMTNGAADVYSVLFLSENAVGVVPLAGTERQIIRVRNPNTIDSGDPLGQRGFVSYKMYHAALILNQNWLVRAEVAASA